MIEKRRSTRIKENLSIQWQVEQHTSQGRGKILNLSETGVLLHTDLGFTPMERCVLSIHAAVASAKEFLPNKGRLVWNKRQDNGYLCGIEFVDTSENVVNLLHKRVEEIMVKIERKQKAVNIAGVVLSLALIGIAVYVLEIMNTNFHTVTATRDMALQAAYQQTQNYNTYVAKYTVTKTELDITTEKLAQVTLALDQVTAEFNSAKTLLAETQGLLNEAQAENTKLKDTLNTLEAAGVQIPQTEKTEALGGVITSLKEENTKYSQQIDSLKNELKAFEIQLSNMKEGKELLALYRLKIKEIKTKMGALKHEAYYAKIASQKERDHLESMAGNLGYIIKEGKSLASEKKTFGIDVKIVQ